MANEYFGPLDFVPVNEKQRKEERAKARDLRHTAWWKNQLREGICYYCSVKTEPELLSMDHKVPVSKGGKSTKNNIVLCCKDCNTKKKNNTAAEMVVNKTIDEK